MTHIRGTRGRWVNVFWSTLYQYLTPLSTHFALINLSSVIVVSRWWSRRPVDIYMMMSANGNIFRLTGHLCEEFTVPGEFPAQRPVTRNFDVFFDLRLNKRLRKQSWGWWFEMLSRPLWRHCKCLVLLLRHKITICTDDKICHTILWLHVF